MEGILLLFYHRRIEEESGMAEFLVLLQCNRRKGSDWKCFYDRREGYGWIPRVSIYSTLEG
jgi:hypothetical protein